MPQTFWDVRHANGQYKGLYLHHSPLRRDAAERLKARHEKVWVDDVIEIVPTSNTAWEEAYGDKS